MTILSSLPLLSVSALSSYIFTFCNSLNSLYKRRPFSRDAHSYWLSWLILAHACIWRYSYSFTLPIHRFSSSILGQSFREALREKHYCSLVESSLRSNSTWLRNSLLRFSCYTADCSLFLSFLASCVCRSATFDHIYLFLASSSARAALN